MKQPEVLPSQALLLLIISGKPGICSSDLRRTLQARGVPRNTGPAFHQAMRRLADRGLIEPQLRKKMCPPIGTRKRATRETIYQMTTRGLSALIGYLDFQRELIEISAGMRALA